MSTIKIKIKIKKMKFIDLCCGIGGFHQALLKLNMKCVYACDIDEECRKIYKINYHIEPERDLQKINVSNIPSFDVLCAGFPCQPFSQVGLGLGERDTRGTLFHDILRICKVKKPKHILLENVKGLIQKNHTNTLQTIISSLRSIGYDIDLALLNSKDYGIPQNRERVWIYAFLGSLPTFFKIET